MPGKRPEQNGVNMKGKNKDKNVSAVFKDSISVNEALRSLMKVAFSVRKTRRTA